MTVFDDMGYREEFVGDGIQCSAALDLGNGWWVVVTFEPSDTRLRTTACRLRPGGKAPGRDLDPELLSRVPLAEIIEAAGRRWQEVDADLEDLLALEWIDDPLRVPISRYKNRALPDYVYALVAVVYEAESRQPGRGARGRTYAGVRRLLDPMRYGGLIPEGDPDGWIRNVIARARQYGFLEPPTPGEGWGSAATAKGRSIATTFLRGERRILLRRAEKVRGQAK